MTEGKHGLPELIAERRAKGERLKQSDPGSFPYAFRGAEPIEGILGAYAHLADGEETEEAHRVAGRVSARRGAGGAAFLDLVDRTGKIQLHARLDVLGTEAFERITSLDLGDIVGVEGAALRSQARRDLVAGRPLRGARQGAQAAAGQAPRPDRRGDPPPQARARPDRQRGDPQAVRRPGPGDHGGARLPRRAGLHRGRDAGAAAALRRGPGAALPDPPQ